MGQGYTDYARLIDWDGPLLLNANAINVNAPVTEGPYDVSKFAGISMAVRQTQGVTLLQVAWFADKARTATLGARQIVLNPNVGLGWIRLLNQGPWVQITLSKITGAPPLINLALMPTNRVGPLESPPLLPQLIAAVGVSLAPATPFSVFPNAFYAGPVRVFAETGGQQYEVNVQCMDVNGVTQNVDAWTVPASTELAVSTVVPLGSWWLSLFNDGAVADSISVWVTPSSSGSL